MYPENINDFQCCSGLTRVQSNPQLPDAGYMCIRLDNYCDSRYENATNSADCRTTASLDTSICQSYYDGCNTCSRSANGQLICTMMACTAMFRPSYCTSYSTYSPMSQSQDDIFVGKVLTEIRNYTSDLSCTSSDQCHWELFGSSPCGSSSIAISYSTKNVNEALFWSKTRYYTDMQRLYNQTYGITGICIAMTAPAPLSCVSGQCTSSY